MKKILLLCAALCLFASSAYAVGCDLTVVACPGVAGASNDAGTLDCAGGVTLVVLGTFQPAEAIADLVAADAILDITVANANSGSNFWDFQTANSAALNGAPNRPATLCSTYTNAFGVANSGFAAAAAVQSPNRVRIATTSYRPSNLAAALNQKIFAFQLSFDLSTSAEANQGGTSTGCQSPAGIVLEQIIPGSASNAPVTTLSTGTGTIPGGLNSVIANGAGLPTAATRHTWGQLKNMYR